MSKLLFLDFDGVLRSTSSDPSRLEAHCIDAFEKSIRRIDGISIVVSSSWRLAYSIAELRRHFSPDIRERIIGATPEADVGLRHYRFEEIQTFLRANRFQERPWVAIDDQVDLFPRVAPVLIVDGKVGFTERDGERLEKAFDGQKTPGRT